MQELLFGLIQVAEMSYNSGTLSAGANAVKELMDTFQPLIDAHAAWQFVEQVAGAGAKRVDVYKCLGSLNSFGTDFFMAFVRGTDNGNFLVLLAEQYDGTLKKFTNGLTTNGSAITVNADGTHANSGAKHVANESCNPTFTTGYLCGPSSPNVGSNQTGTVVAPSSPWYLSVTNDAVVVSCGTNQVYVGAYESAYSPSIDPFPIVATHLHPNTSYASSFSPTFGASAMGQSGFTREIGGAGSFANAASGGIDRGLIQCVGTGNTSVQKDPISNLWNASRLVLTSGVRRAVRRGLLADHVLAIPMAEPATEAVGDIITIDGVVYTCFLVPNTTIYNGNYLDSIWVSQGA